MPLEARNTGDIDALDKPQGGDKPHHRESLRHHGHRKSFCDHPFGGKPARGGPDRNAYRCGNGEPQDFHAAQQVTNRLRIVGTGCKAPHLPAQGGSDPHVQQRQPSLQDRKNTNKAVGFNSEVSDVERDERQAH